MLHPYIACNGCILRFQKYILIERGISSLFLFICVLLPLPLTSSPPTGRIVAKGAAAPSKGHMMKLAVVRYWPAASSIPPDAGDLGFFLRGFSST